MQLAVNFSEPLADLVGSGSLQLDRFKCPAWPDLVERAGRMHPVYVHFPLKVGKGIGDAVDSETGHPADWAKVQMLMDRTGTPMVNLHLTADPADHPQIPPAGIGPEHVAALVDALVRDIAPVVERFGAARVILENHHGGRGSQLRAGLLPTVLHRVLAQTGCGFLLDVSHARLAAQVLGLDARDYIDSLPVGHAREIHLTGIQRLDARWIDRLSTPKLDAWLKKYAGQWMDHLPMTADDWEFTAWVAKRVEEGAWQSPWVVAWEVGGVGGLWELVADKDTLAVQVPRLYALFGHNKHRD